MLRISLFFLLFSNTVLAQHIFTAADTLGEYTYKEGLSVANSDNRYLDCGDEKVLIIDGNDTSIELSGITPQYPITFEKIDQGKNGVPGLYAGYSQWQTVTVKESQTELRIETQHRNCAGFPLGAAGCFKRKWRTTAWIEFKRDLISENTTVTLGYQPFKHTPTETCTYAQ